MKTFSLPVVEQGPLMPERYLTIFDHWGAAPDQFMRADWATSIIGLGMQAGPVGKHTDDSIPNDAYVVGWIAESDGHMLCVGGCEPIELKPGCFYCLDPNIIHWTEAEPLAMIKFFWTKFPRSLPFLVRPLMRVFTDELDQFTRRK